MSKQAANPPDHLLIQLQAWAGPRLPKEGLVPPPSGTRNALHFGYLGDMQLAFVIQPPGTTQSLPVQAQGLAQLGLTPGRAVALGATNVRRLGGEPRFATMGDGVHALRSALPGYNAVYLFDRGFWRAQLAKCPQGLLAALPCPSVLLFAPAGDPAVEAELARQAARTYAAAGDDRLSRCLYRFDSTGWQPHADLPAPEQPPLRAPMREEDEDEDATSATAPATDPDDDLETAAQGQKILIRSILAAFLLNAMARVPGSNLALMFALSLALSYYSLRGVVRLGEGLGKSTGGTVVAMTLTFVPLLNIVVWIMLSLQTTRRLRDAGWSVGLMGART